MNRKTVLIIIITLIIGIIIGGCLVFFIKSAPKKADNTNGTTTTVEGTTNNSGDTTTTTTEATTTTADPKETALGLIKFYFYNDLFAYGESCTPRVCEDEYIMVSDSDFIHPLKNYKTMKDLKEYMTSYMTSSMITKETKKFTEKNGKVYCLIYSSAFPYINDNSVQITKATLTDSNTIEAYAQYTFGGDELFELETVKVKVIIKKVNDKWLLDSITKIK